MSLLSFANSCYSHSENVLDQIRKFIGRNCTENATITACNTFQSCIKFRTYRLAILLYNMCTSTSITLSAIYYYIRYCCRQTQFLRSFAIYQRTSVTRPEILADFLARKSRFIVNNILYYARNHFDVYIT